MWPVLLPPYGATAITRRLPCVGGQPRLVTTWRLSSRIRGRRGRAGVISFSHHVHREAKRPSSKVSLVTFNLQPTISNYRLLRTRSQGLMTRCGPVAFPPPSPTDDHRPPTPTVVTEVMCGERRREAFGTCARVAGSLVSVASPAASLGATAIACRLPCVGGQPRLVTTWRLSSRTRGRRGRAGVSIPLSYREAMRSPLTASLVDFKCGRHFLS